ncbi:MAG: 3-methyl-2-oxobutanoate hydroxymethyltransferase [Victivallaceae bacterium]|nr:3-methyl-2-oxobutanoate hydroxymethyltransferase [Victivallaceae bacterium]
MSDIKRRRVSDFAKMKQSGEKIVMLTAYDAPTAALAAAAKVDLLLVGDSMAMTVLGYRNTLPLTIEESIHHCKAVRRGAPDAFVVGDMPFMSFGSAMVEQSVRNAGRYLKEADCDAVKLEGGAETAGMVSEFVRAGIPVVAHIGLMPQKVLISGYRVQGKSESDAECIVKDALTLQEAGAFMVVLECIPRDLSRIISEKLTIPTIGIGAGVGCDGQVQVIHDILGLFDGFTPKHAKRYAEIGREITEAISSYVGEVKAGLFPDDQHSH